MGNISTTLARKASKPLKNFAVEARAEKVISREKPVPAPWHPSTQKKIDELKKQHPDILKEFDKRDTQLEGRLKDVYVTSHDPTVPEREVNPNRPLPNLRENVGLPELGYREPAKVPKGKLSLRQALTMIGKHQQNAETNSVMSLANEFTVHPKVAGNILEYFRAFEVYEPPDSKIKLSVKNYIKLESSPSANHIPQIEEKKKEE